MIRVLYPALDTSNMVQSNDKPKTINSSPIVSLNRFERKKNIGLLIQSYAYIQNKYPTITLPKLIIAGGYDTQNVENVEYRGELQNLTNELNVVDVDFRLDISDEERAVLFQTALCVVYTPDKEHFGIVPLEAMYAGTPVLAVRSGGPKETVIDGKTGLLRDPTPESFGEALLSLIKDPKMATTMGRNGRTHVEQTFGTDRFAREWKVLVEQTKERQEERAINRRDKPKLVLWVNTSVYLLEAAIALFVCLVLTWFLRQVGILGSSQSIIGGIRTRLMGDEL